MLKLAVGISVLVIVINSLKFTKLTELREEEFYEKTGVKYDKNTGKVNSATNAMIYFFISGQ